MMKPNQILAGTLLSVIWALAAWKLAPGTNKASAEAIQGYVHDEGRVVFCEHQTVAIGRGHGNVYIEIEWTRPDEQRESWRQYLPKSVGSCGGMQAGSKVLIRRAPIQPTDREPWPAMLESDWENAQRS